MFSHVPRQVPRHVHIHVFSHVRRHVHVHVLSHAGDAAVGLEPQPGTEASIVFNVPRHVFIDRSQRCLDMVFDTCLDMLIVPPVGRGCMYSWLHGRYTGHVAAEKCVPDMYHRHMPQCQALYHPQY